jgi:hypothetical protein
MSELDILIREVARIALEDKNIARYIGHELDVTDEELEDVALYLNGMLEEAPNNVRYEGDA